MTSIASALVGAAVVVVVWAAFGWRLGFDWPARATDGVDGRPSTSKFQFLLWTAVILWAFAAVVARRWIDGASLGDIGMPTNLFILMGLGAGTAVGAKIVTVNRGGRTPRGDKAHTYTSLVADDDGNPALEKIQVMAWTLVAVGVFIVSVWQALADATPPTSLPNVDDALLVLLGVGQVAYVGVKAIPTGTIARRPEAAAATGAATGAAARAGATTTPEVHDSL